MRVVILGITGLFLLSACGIQGDLYLPDQPKKQSKEDDTKTPTIPKDIDDHLEHERY